MEPLLQLLAVAVLVALVVWLVTRWIRLVTVHDHERGLRFRRGRLVGLVSSGIHLRAGPFEEIEVIDARPTALVVEGQEVMTAEGVPVKVSLAIRYVVADPVAAYTGDTDYRRALYLLLQLTLRDALAGRTLDAALAARKDLGPAIRQACASELATLGVELLAVEVRDLMVPGELKRAYASVITARKEGEAALERARGETAALRNLANAGRLVEGSPGLLQLRIVQQLGASSGNTVVVGVPDAGQPTVATVTTGRRRRSISTAASEEADGTEGRPTA